MIFFYLAFAAYVVVCLIVASYGRSRRIGTTGFFLLSLLFTPVLVALLLLVTGQGGREPPRQIERS
ncbi:hypothetical protein [Azospirillum sp. sgz302134]